MRTSALPCTSLRRNFNAIALAWLICGCAILPRVDAATLEIPLALDYRILEQTLREQVFSGPGVSAEVFADRIRCNMLVLSQPGVSGTDDGRVRILSAMQAHTGTPLGGKCLFGRSWHGLVETLQTAVVDPGRQTVTFRIVDSTILRSDDQRDLVPHFMQNWIRDYVLPRLGAIRIDLRPAVRGIQDLLDSMAALRPAEPQTGAAGLTSPLTLSDARLTAKNLVAVLSLEVAPVPAGWTPQAEAPLNEEELARWDAAWQAWDGFATWLVKTLAASAGPEQTAELAQTLLEARYDLRDALAQSERDRDPVRALFLKTWEQLAPLLHETDLQLPGSPALQYATFISAGDALLAMDMLAPHVGMRLDRDSLRYLARTLVPGVSDDQLRYDTAVDPELRALLGLEPDFATDGPAVSLLAWLISSAHAAQIDPALVERLNSWVPRRREIDPYLQLMERLLNVIAQAERDNGKVPSAFLDVYDTLLRATAFQESCWRQYVEEQGTVQTLRSSAGSVGLMQINIHVWRGIYDLDALTTDIGYNARAGNEILVHYMVDYAIRKKEYDVPGQADSLARATYAVYNGGPRHLTRYRDANASASLQHIDTVFWQKYRAIRNEGYRAVMQCLAG